MLQAQCDDWHQELQWQVAPHEFRCAYGIRRSDPPVCFVYTVFVRFRDVTNTTAAAEAAAAQEEEEAVQMVAAEAV